MMCAGSAELRERSSWLGSGDQSRRALLEALQRMHLHVYVGSMMSLLTCFENIIITTTPEYVPSGVMIPQRRLETLLEQAKDHQRSQCRYHASDPPISLYKDHVCDRSVFPTQTTHILGGHDDQVWRVQFSHNGAYLATTSKDGTALVWRVGVSFTASPSVSCHCPEF